MNSNLLSLSLTLSMKYYYFFPHVKTAKTKIFSEKLNLFSNFTLTTVLAADSVGLTFFFLFTKMSKFIWNSHFSHSFKQIAVLTKNISTNSSSAVSVQFSYFALNLVVSSQRQKPEKESGASFIKHSYTDQILKSYGRCTVWFHTHRLKKKVWLDV